MDGAFPILVRPAIQDNDEPPEGLRIDVLAASSTQKPLTVSVPETVLEAISENTSELQDKLNKFVNGLNSKIQSVVNSRN